MGRCAQVTPRRLLPQKGSEDLVLNSEVNFADCSAFAQHPTSFWYVSGSFRPSEKTLDIRKQRDGESYTSNIANSLAICRRVNAALADSEFATS